MTGLPTHYRMNQELPVLLEQWRRSAELKVAFLLIQLDSKYEMVKRTPSRVSASGYSTKSASG